MSENKNINKFSYSSITEDKDFKGGIPFSSKLTTTNPKDPWGLIDAFNVEWKNSGINFEGEDVQSTGHFAYLIQQGIERTSNINRFGGIPVLDKEWLEKLKANNTLPDKYVAIPNEYELKGKADPIQYEDSGNGYYLDIIFNTLRALQSKINKIENTFKYGIYSYSDERTAISSILGDDYNKTKENEPLWATEESDLSDVGIAFPISDQYQFELLSNIVEDPETNKHKSITLGEDKVIIDKDGAFWEDNGDLMTYFSTNEDEDLNMRIIDIDPKLYLFATTSSTNIKITLKNTEKELQSKDHDLIIDLSKLNIPKTTANKYNILVIVNRATWSNDKQQYYNENYVWLSVGDWLTGSNIREGYWESDKLYDIETKLGNQKDSRYSIHKVDFGPMELYKFKLCYKNQDFTNKINPDANQDEKYKYEVAHITIRKVNNLETLKNIKNQLPEDELIYVKNLNQLWIKTDNDVRCISGGSNGNTDDNKDSGMTQEETLKWLERNGIVGMTPSGDTNTISMNRIGDITFINQETGKSYKYAVDSDGNLKGTEVPVKDLKTQIEESGIDMNADNNTNIRGFVGTLRCAQNGLGKDTDYTADAGLNSDRIKIGAVYVPHENQTTFGCSHAYIELENTSDQDFPLDGCYLHYCTQKQLTETTKDTQEYSIALHGTLPAGGTFLIRGKQYAKYNDSNVFIKVKTFDQEWYHNNELIDIRLHNANTFLLTYDLPGKDINEDSAFDYNIALTGTKSIGSGSKATQYHTYNPCFIDSISIGAPISSESGGITWCHTDNTAWKDTGNDAIYKNMHELDPAKQAYQGLAGTVKYKKSLDSSRGRGNKSSDKFTMTLESPYIEFPKTEDKYPISMFTPKASYEKKNVCTDKTQLDMDVPNMINSSFGSDINTTRCFNWISGGLFDEFIWVRKKGTTEWSRFESYKNNATIDKDARTVKYNDDKDYISVDMISDSASKKHYGLFYNETKKSIDTIESVIYNRITNKFPAIDLVYTSHKCVLQLRDKALTDAEGPVEYEYVVGRADKLLNPDPNHTSTIYEFTLYPSTYTPVIYQITDQQGFWWLEYQVWNNVAEDLDKTIKFQCGSNIEEKKQKKIVPILVNTGDMTQNGTRINEWLDYYNAGISLFRHLEQVNVVGNNDLCDTDINKLGTGDDNGKSNSYFFHLFYCYDINTEKINESVSTDSDLYVSNFKSLPIVSNENSTKNIPSFYSISNGTHGLVLVNSEITYINCLNWFKEVINVKGEGNSTTQCGVNIYTGWSVPSTDTFKYYEYNKREGFRSIYEMLYSTFDDLINTKHISPNNIVVACHEMPFTVVTNKNLEQQVATDNLGSGMQLVDRSLKEKNNGALVGCHMNRINYLDTNSNYWFSRLLEYFNIKLCIGGHKHTYMCTNPIRELYSYKKENNTVYSIDNPMDMPKSLGLDSNGNKLDTASFDLYVKEDKTRTTDSSKTYVLCSESEAELKINSSKFPLIESSTDLGTGLDLNTNLKVYFPYYGISKEKMNNRGIIYFMCQASGYKLKSNKELPSPNQRFAYVIPLTTVGTSSDSPDLDQLMPMFAIINMGNNTSNSMNKSVVLVRDAYVQPKGKTLAQGKGQTKPSKYQTFIRELDTNKKDIIYGKWTEERNVYDFTITDKDILIKY